MKSKSNYFKALFYSALLIIFILAIIPDTNELPEITKLSDKLNYLIAFFILAILIDLAYPIKSSLWKFYFLVWYGILIEFIQYFLPDREISIFDLAADIAGLLFYFFIRRVRKLVFSLNG